MPRTEADEAAAARAKLAALKAKRDAAQNRAPHAPHEAVAGATDPHAVIHAVFGPGAEDDEDEVVDDRAAWRPEDGEWATAADLIGEKFKMGYANGVIRCSFVIPAQHFHTVQRLEEVSDGYELRFVIQAPPEIL